MEHEHDDDNDVVVVVVDSVRKGIYAMIRYKAHISQGLSYWSWLVEEGEVKCVLCGKT